MYVLEFMIPKMNNTISLAFLVPFSSWKNTCLLLKKFAEILLPLIYSGNVCHGKYIVCHGKCIRKLKDCKYVQFRAVQQENHFLTFEVFIQGDTPLMIFQNFLSRHSMYVTNTWYNIWQTVYSSIVLLFYLKCRISVSVKYLLLCHLIIRFSLQMITLFQNTKASKKAHSHFFAALTYRSCMQNYG